MRDYINRLSRGNSIIKVPKLSCSEEQITMDIMCNTVATGSFICDATDKVYGMVYADNERVKIFSEQFGGTHIITEYQVDASGLEENDEIEGTFTVVCNAGEKKIPFVFRCMKENQDDIRNHVKTEAVVLHIDNEENTIIHKDEAEQFECVLIKSGTEETEIDIYADADFIELEKGSLSTDDFAGDRAVIKYIVNPQKMHAGNNYGYIHIVSYTQHLKINVSVICKKADESEDFEVRREEKLAQYKLTKLYLDFRMKKIKIGLLPRIIIAIILGIAIGTIFPAPLVRIFVTFNGIFSEFLNFSIPLIIVGLVTVAIADIGKGAGKMLLVTALIAYGATLFSGFLSYFTGVTVFPSLIEVGAPLEEVSEAHGILPYFSVSIPPLMNVMTALILAFTLGLGLAALHSDALKSVARDFQEIVVRMISAVILPLLPLYIFGIFLNMTHSGQVYAILMVFIKIIGVIFLLHIFLLVFQYSIAALFVRKNPLRLLGRMMPAYFTALGTQSSAATIPVTLEQTKKNGVSADIAGFVIPLCATIHLSGSTLKIVACALALMMMQGMPFDFPLFAGFIFMLGITMVAAPGVPGGAIMAALGILQSMLGFDESAQALMIALYIAMDSFGTACNVTGDGAIALIIDKVMGKGTGK